MTFPAIAVAVTVAIATIQDQLSVGSLVVGIIGSIIVVTGAVFGVHYKTLADSRRQALTDERERHEIASRERREALDQVSELKVELEKLRALPNLTIIIEKMAETARHQDERSMERMQVGMDSMREIFDAIMASHDHQAAQRQTELLAEIRAWRNR